jgi:hypothetical protein
LMVCITISNSEKVVEAGGRSLSEILIPAYES